MPSILENKKNQNVLYCRLLNVLTTFAVKVIKCIVFSFRPSVQSLDITLPFFAAEECRVFAQAIREVRTHRICTMIRSTVIVGEQQIVRQFS